VTVHRRLKTNSITNSRKVHAYSQSNNTNQNSAYTSEAKSLLRINSNMRFVSSKDHFETTQHHHKRKKKKSKFVHTFSNKIFTFLFHLDCLIFV